MREHHAAVHALPAQGCPRRRSGASWDCTTATVRKFVTARSVDDLIAKTEQRAHLVDAWTGHLHRRWHEGERNATALFREISQLGYPGGELAVQRYLRRFRRGRGHAPHPGPKPPSVRQVTGWIMTHPDDLDQRDATELSGIRDRDSDLHQLTAHVRAFAAMMTGRHGDRLETWITRPNTTPCTPLAAFARHLRRDLDAVRARPEPALQLRASRRQHQPAQNAQTPDVRPRQPRPAAKTRPPSQLTPPHDQRQNPYLHHHASMKITG